MDLLGQRFGDLFVSEQFGTDPARGNLWLCRCDCGNEVIRSTGEIRRLKHAEIFREWAMANGYSHNPDAPLGDRASIDRVDPNGHYEPGNCRWIPHRENARRAARKVSHVHV